MNDAGSLARIIAQGQLKKAEESFGLCDDAGVKVVLKLQAQPLFRDPTFDAIVGANGVHPAGRLEISVENIEGDAGPHDRAWFCSLGV